MTAPVEDRDIVSRMVRRMDAIEGQFTRMERERLRALQGDIAAVKRSVERLVAAKGPSDGQPDWIGCRDPEAAQDLLLGVDDWTLRYAVPLGADLLGCWPWHSGSVALLLAAMHHHTAVMAGDVEAAVTDYLLRVVPSLGKRLVEIGRKCNDEQHRIGDAWFAYDRDRLVDLAMWWSTDRLGLAPGLTPWTDRVR